MTAGHSSSSYPAAPFGFEEKPCDHAAIFYLDEEFLTRLLCDFVAASLRSGQSAVVLATGEHHRSLAKKLAAFGIDLSDLKNTRRYTEIDADEILSQCVVAGTPDIWRLNLLVSQAMTVAQGATNLTHSQAKSRDKSRTLVFGELVARLWAKRDLCGVLAVEKFWNRLAEHFSFSLLCGYPIRDFDREGSEEPFLRICATHSTVIPPVAYATPQSEKRLLHATARAYLNAQTKAQTVPLT